MAKNKRKTLAFADVFAGCGGLSLGLMQAGLKGKFAIEKDESAFETLSNNLIKSNSEFRYNWPQWLPKEAMTIDHFLKTYKEQICGLKGKIDLLAGGPPCQGFSSAGRRKQDDPRNSLFESYLETVELLKPRAVLIENVRGFTMDFQSKKTVKNYSAILRDRLSKNYDVYEKLLDLSKFGVPQRRIRYFLLALQPNLYQGDPFDLISKRMPSFLRTLRLQPPVTSWSAISDLEISRGGTKPSRDTEGFEEIGYVEPITHYQELMEACESGPGDLRLARHSDEVAHRFRKIIESSQAEGRLNTTISNDLKLRFGLKKRALRVLDPDNPAPTITSLPDDLIHYSEPRTLTVRENARLQSFPDWFDFKGKYTTGGNRRRREVPRFTQVANAVPPLAARAIGEALLEILSQKHTPTKEFSTSYTPATKQANP